jgi:hypothetical protein
MRLLHPLILRAAALIVPGDRREEWLAEWRAELWHVERSAPGRAIAFCLGAVADAYWLRRDHVRTVALWHSPAQCIFSLAAFATLLAVIAFLLPGAKDAMRPSRYRDTPDLVTISRHRTFPASAMISVKEYRSWKDTTQHLFRDLAFYQPVLAKVRIPGKRMADLSIARASINLFDLLKIRVERNDRAVLMLSRAAWRNFSSMQGREVEVAGQQAIVGGPIPDGLWELPERVDAWLLFGDQTLATLPPDTPGVVVGKVRTAAFPKQTDGRWYMAVQTENGGSDLFDCAALAGRMKMPIGRFLLTILFACAVLPATTSLSLGEYPGGQPSIRRWLFLSGKIALVLVIAFFASLDFCHLGSAISSARLRTFSSVADLTLSASFRCALSGMACASFFLPAVLARAQGDQRWIRHSIQAMFFLPFASCGVLKVMKLGRGISTTDLQILMFLGLCILALRWVLIDQRQRCPVCLRLLTNPSRVGQPSRNFLEWSGTELICVRGHGLLHVPETPTSWFATQRWLYLDASWSGLFSARQET